LPFANWAPQASPLSSLVTTAAHQQQQHHQQQQQQQSGLSHLPSARIAQHQARAYRGEQRDRANFDTSIARHDYNMASQRLACQVPCQSGCIVPSSVERLPQIYAKEELFAPAHSLATGAQQQQHQYAAASALQSQHAPLSIAPSLRRAEQVSARLPTVDLREARAFESAESRAFATGGSNGNNAGAALASTTRAAAQREGVFSLSAAQAEKSKYLDSYKSGNEEAYAHVDALQRSVRGYDDTSQETLQRVKQWNAREAAQRQFLGNNA
jgi:hypothetical protein